MVFNNNNRSRVGGRETAQAPTNAEMLRDALELEQGRRQPARLRSSRRIWLKRSGASTLTT